MAGRNSESQPQRPGCLADLLTFGAAGKLHEAWENYIRNRERELATQRKREEREALFGPTESALGLIRRWTKPLPCFPADLSFAVLERPHSEDPQSRFWDLLGVPSEPLPDSKLLILAPNPLSPNGEFNPDLKTRVFLQSAKQGLEIKTGIIWGTDYAIGASVRYLGDNREEQKGMEDGWKKAGLVDNPVLQEGAAAQGLFLFLIANLSQFRGMPTDQQLGLLYSLRPDIDYFSLQREASGQRRSPFEYTPREYLAWLPLEDGRNVEELMSALKKFTQEDSFSFGLVATGSMTDPTRRWSQGSIPEIDLLFYLAAEKRESYDPNKLAAFLQETLGWSCDFSEGHKAWDEYDDTHPPYFKLVPQTGRYIELHPDWEIWQTPQDIRSLIGQIRSSNRGEQLRNPYFCVLIEP